jgi:gliding motility-associated-like protein
MSKIYLPIFLIVLQFISASVCAQISSTTSDFKVATVYSAHDSIFIFNQGATAKKGSFKAIVPGSIPATYVWSAYDTVNHVFSAPFQTDANVLSSVASNLNQGGYRVRVTRPGLDTTMMAWVFLNSMSFSVEKNNAGEVHFYRRTCEYTNLQANAVPSKFNYFNVATKTRYTLNNTVNISWTANPSNSVRLGDGAKIWIEGDDLPNEDTEYTARATDKFGFSKEDKVKYISIIPKSDFETSYKKKYSDSVASAPVTVEFTNNSKNAVKYTWIFGDGDTTILKAPDTTPELHVYYIAGKDYKIKLIAESKEKCVREDTATIKVSQSELDAPNFFTPGDDPFNDKFVIRNVSMREFHLTIFTRSGRKVYEFHGPDINAWEGWNGQLNGNGQALSAGIYYYVLEAMSWEQPSQKYSPVKFSKFVYLIRNK